MMNRIFGANLLEILFIARKYLLQYLQTLSTRVSRNLSFVPYYYYMVAVGSC